MAFYVFLKIFFRVGFLTLPFFLKLWYLSCNFYVVVKKVVVEYNGKDKQGYQEKELTIYSNTNPVEETIKIIANIKSKK